VIPNHYSASLSALDLQMAHAIPPGGNWKNIPTTVPSARLDQIRESYRLGKGSRSTYYGRLRADAPSYTISTYFNRPGNGCHLHYDYAGEQHRVISQREAARLQSFPDDFVFTGSKSAVNTQIGNAVPPLLAYQIALTLGQPGLFVDLFAGAGGLALGFVWAGWQPVVANDIAPAALETYARNVHDSVILGDIRKPEIMDEIVARARAARIEMPHLPLFVLGGPPCQGFSTAGKARTMEDERNALFQNYRMIVEALAPDGFVFENVPGLVNMEGGRVFKMVKESLNSVTDHLTIWQPQTERYGVPQRRKRVVIVGRRGDLEPLTEPVAVCGEEGGLFDLQRPVSVMEALNDLPPLTAGQDGSSMTYVHAPQTSYQALMRGTIGAAEYLARLREPREVQVG